MRKAAFLLTALLLLFMTVQAYSDEIELGLSWTPVMDDAVSADDEVDSIRGFHLGYVMWGFVYFSWDALVMPPSIIQNWTGFYRPGFLNLYDVGVTFYFKPFTFYGELGLNNVYVYRQGSNQALKNNFGANLRIGGGLKWDWIGVNLSGTAVFHSFESMAATLAELVRSDSSDRAAEKIGNAIVPSLNVVLYF